MSAVPTCAVPVIEAEARVGFTSEIYAAVCPLKLVVTWAALKVEL